MRDDPNAEDDIITNIKYINWSLAWGGGVIGSSNVQNFSLTANMGIRNLPNDPLEFNLKRFGAQANYLYLRGAYDITQALPWDMDVYWKVNGQLSPQALINNEQFSIGGLQSVRGYFEAQILGDRGLQTQLELRSPNFGPGVWSRFQNLYAYGFVDYGTVGLRESLLEEKTSFQIASLGAGFRLYAFGGFLGTLDYAYPLKDTVAREKGDSQLLFRLRYSK